MRTSLCEQFDAAGLDFEVIIDARDLYLDADPARLQQIIANLLSNAAKYTPRGGKVVLSVTCEDDFAGLRVRDTGTGLPKNMLDSVFDLFVQASQTLDRSAGGIGVGLTLVRSLVTMHGGTAQAYSEGEGKGCEFVVRLPRATSEIAEESAESESALGPRSRLKPGAKIVIVEDNADSREMLCEILETAGYECIAAADGSAGLAVIDEVRPGVAIVDIGLPQMDGYEVARRVRRSSKHSEMWLIALTGYGQMADRGTEATRRADPWFVAK